jgi:hypothetical protein
MIFYYSKENQLPDHYQVWTQYGGGFVQYDRHDLAKHVQASGLSRFLFTLSLLKVAVDMTIVETSMNFPNEINGRNCLPHLLHFLFYHLFVVQWFQSSC